MGEKKKTKYYKMNVLKQQPSGPHKQWLTVLHDRGMPKGMTIKGSEHNLEHMNVKVAQSRPTLRNPMDYTIRGILQAGVVKWIAVPFSKGSSPPRDRT